MFRKLLLYKYFR